AEAARIARDLEVLRYAVRRSQKKPHLHIQHLSTKRGLELVQEAKTAGLPVTAEATPHHLTLTEEALKSFDPILKV
ncbi:dihydroorotase, partial [Acinetobacter baumannii]